MKQEYFLNMKKQICFFFILLCTGLLFGGTVSAADTVVATSYRDFDNDGLVDHIRIQFDENVDQCTFEAGDWSVETAGTINVVSIDGITTGSIAGDSCDGSFPYVFLQVTADANVTGGATDPQISYTNQGTTGSLSGVTTAELSSTGTLTATDVAPPVFVSTSPADAATGVARTTDVVITFSEPMDTDFVEGTEFTISPDPGGVSAAWTSGDTVVTLSLPDLACGVVHTITTVEAEIDAASGTATTVETSGPVDGDFSFTTVTGGCSSGTSDVGTSTGEVSYDIGLEAMSHYLPGVFTDFVWTSSNNFSFVDLFYSMDDGDTYTIFADNADNNGLYRWNIPTDLDGSLVIKIEATDLVSVLATDTIVIAPEEDGEADDVTEDEEVVEAMPAWDVPGVEPGDVIRGESMSAVYFITEDYQRRVFISEQVFFTWHEDFDNVKVIADSDLGAFALGGLMLPKAGVVLVKIQSDPRVYALGEGEDVFSPLLHEIASEEDAEMLWGTDWSGYVIDVEPTFIAGFDTGEVVNVELFDVDMEQMKTRVELQS